jgi:hypothetical protein
MLNIIRYISYAALLSMSFGCVSQIQSIQSYAKGWVGAPISELIEVKNRPQSYAMESGWKEKHYDLPNGNWIYVSPEREGCIIHWEVNQSGVIVSYRAEGEYCY